MEESIAIPIIKYIFHNWIDLGILLVLIIILRAMFYNTNFICDNKIIPMLSQIDDHLIDVKLNTEEIEKNTVAIYRK